MPEAFAFPSGTPVWWEAVSDDPPATAAFYQRLFAWQVRASVPGYRFCLRGERAVAAVVDGARHRGVADPGWLPSLFAPALDETCERVERHGGAVLAPPAAVDGEGRRALVRDPGGAVCALWAASHLPDPAPVRAPGHLGRVGLLAGDPRRSTEFYASVFGGGHGDVQRGGVQPGLPGVPAFLGVRRPRPAHLGGDRWLPDFLVEDLTRAVRAVRDGGGRDAGADTAGSGATIMTDPAGVPFGLTALDSLPAPE
ncbi:VOC family protein [Streptomyces sp. ODS05-4]|uniref:VOC family protein n=1 Tax=Streptomyces sp. ODS05-4 TaxID=2944939 RepID=UPI00210DBC32|nr:VOC family protein [Streptomyces sp. ODS05-4]